jgi:hypothetical protein
MVSLERGLVGGVGAVVLRFKVVQKGVKSTGE